MWCGTVSKVDFRFSSFTFTQPTVSTLTQPPDPAPDPAMAPVQADRQATSSSRQSTPSTAPIVRPSQIIPTLPAPPIPPSWKGLDLLERNAVKREYEKSMYKYMSQHGTLSTTEICGPCERNHTPCIRLPTMKKCALCFRGHDVCEMWDETVTNMGRRRTNHPKNQKKESKKDNKVPYLNLRGKRLIIDG